MLNFLYQNHVDVHTELSNRQSNSEIECVIPFNPDRKTQLTVTRIHKGDKNVRVVLKGAPEYVFEHCSFILDDDVEHPIKLTPDLKK